jgi:hypothetical protein
MTSHQPHAIANIESVILLVLAFTLGHLFFAVINDFIKEEYPERKHLGRILLFGLLFGLLIGLAEWFRSRLEVPV